MGVSSVALRSRIVKCATDLTLRRIERVGSRRHGAVVSGKLALGPGHYSLLRGQIAAGRIKIIRILLRPAAGRGVVEIVDGGIINPDFSTGIGNSGAIIFCLCHGVRIVDVVGVVIFKGLL